tara:strand:- start:1146 stop:2246 length:1101 start_codon:yes stop_codon:yes gene_type:complete
MIPNRKTPLYKKHISLNGNMTNFAGFLLPTHYTSINFEHNLVRSKVGIFDVSHMGEFIVSGKDSFSFLQKITINDLRKLKIGQAQYTAMCYKNGGIVDDLLIYKKENEFMVVVNASNREKDFSWMAKNISGDVKIKDISDEIALIAIQGPNSKDVLQKAVENDDLNSIKYYHFNYNKIAGHDVIISRTGYTGELGYEIYIDNDGADNIWEKLMQVGKYFGIGPAGLACRDTLRLEMKYLLYGADINENITPIEAGLGWITKFDKKDFIGRESLINLKNKINRRLVCIQMQEKAIPRNGCKIYSQNKEIGSFTSGTMSPSLDVGIGIGYVATDHSHIGQNLVIDIRGKNKKGIIVKPPFYKRGTLMK